MQGKFQVTKISSRENRKDPMKPYRSASCVFEDGTTFELDLYGHNAVQSVGSFVMTVVPMMANSLQKRGDGSEYSVARLAFRVEAVTAAAKAG